LVEDDAMIGEAVRTGLRQDGFTVDWVREAEAGDAAIKAEAYSLLLLDLGLPRKSGLDWLRELRRRGNRLPVLILTARDAVAGGGRRPQQHRPLH
jgi:two-component system response regulator QseB